MSGSDWIDDVARDITVQIMKERHAIERGRTLEEWEAAIRRSITERLPDAQKTTIKMPKFALGSQIADFSRIEKTSIIQWPD